MLPWYRSGVAAFVTYLVTDAIAGSAFLPLSGHGPKTVLDGLPERLVSDNYNVMVLEGVLMVQMLAYNKYVLSLFLSISLSLFISLSLSLSFSLLLLLLTHGLSSGMSLNSSRACHQYQQSRQLMRWYV